MNIYFTWASNDFSLLGLKHEYIELQNTETGETKEHLLLEVGFMLFTISIIINTKEE